MPLTEELLIDFRELIGEHSGENMAEAVWATMELYGLVGKVSFLHQIAGTSSKSWYVYRSLPSWWTTPVITTQWCSPLSGDASNVAYNFQLKTLACDACLTLYIWRQLRYGFFCLSSIISNILLLSSWKQLERFQGLRARRRLRAMAIIKRTLQSPSRVNMTTMQQPMMRSTM